MKGISRFDMLDFINLEVKTKLFTEDRKTYQIVPFEFILFER